MQDLEAKPLIPPPERGPRLFIEDRGPWIFALYWYSFRFHLRNEPPQRAMSFFGLSSELRAVLLENERTAPLARRFDLRSRMLMAIGFIPGIICVSAFIMLCGLPGHLVHSLREQYPILATTLVLLALLALVLLAIFTRDLHRSFKDLFDVYNAPDDSDGPDGSDGSDTAEPAAAP